MDQDSKTNWNRAGLAALILLAPGGFILGATLGARYLRKRAEAREAEAETKTGDSPEA